MEKLPGGGGDGVAGESVMGSQKEKKIDRLW